MEMLNIPPAQPQKKPAASAKSPARKEARDFFNEALDNAGTGQAKEKLKKPAKAEKQAAGATEDTRHNPWSNAVTETELQQAGMPSDNIEEGELVEEKRQNVGPGEVAQETLPGMAGQLMQAPDRSVATTQPLDNQEGVNSVTGREAHNAQGAITTNSSEASVVEDDSEPGTLSILPKGEGVAESPAISKPGPPPPGQAPAVGLRTGNPTADSHRQSTPQPLAAANLQQTSVVQGEQQKGLEPIEGQKQSGLMESSLGSLLQEVKPLREDLRGQTVAEGNRNATLTLAATANEPRPVPVSAQNGDTLSSFSFEQKAEAMLNGPGEKATGTGSSADGTLFDAALNSGLNNAQAIREGTHPLATSTTEAGSIRLSSGEFLSENQVVDQVLQRIHLEGSNEQSRIVIKMHPEELGEIKLALTLEKDQLRAQLLTQNQQVQEVLEKHLPRLHEALNHQGVRLEDIQVSVDSNRHSGREFFDQQQQTNSFRRPFNTPSGGVVDDPAVAAGMTNHRNLTEGLSLRV